MDVFKMIKIKIPINQTIQGLKKKKKKKKKGDYRVRKTLESWHTAKTVDADNNSKPLPRQYSILL